MLRLAAASIVGWAFATLASGASGGDDDAARFRSTVAPILRGHCLRCHQGADAQGNVDLSRPSGVIEGVGDGWAIVPGDPAASRLIEVISGSKPAMPKAGDHLTPEQIATLRAWVAAGARWPEGEVVRVDPLDWWSLRPLNHPPVPSVRPEWAGRVRNPVDAFILHRLDQAHLAPSPEADRRTLIRRVAFDLTGLPPSPDEVRAFEADPAPDAYERLVDRLLASPRLGERWGRHWLDVAHYADTHGYDKDQPRPHAWPYRDYVIRAFNDDKPYGRFVLEQVAGDVLFAGTRDGVEATGFLAAGPWDLIGHAEVPETKVDGQIARLLDRDDMVASTLNTFTGLTVQCARCHDHKFDPVTQADYYGMQAVFAALDRTDRPYDADPARAARRAELTQRAAHLATELANAEQSARRGPHGPALADLDRQSAAAEAARSDRSPAFGYHGGIADSADTPRWVRLDLGRSVPIARVVLYPCDDDFRGIGPGFGFPVRFRVEASADPEFSPSGDSTTIADCSGADWPNPRLASQGFDAPPGTTARFVRVLATRLASRRGDYNFALAEVAVLGPDGSNFARGAVVAAPDSIEAPPRWGRANLVDGIWPTDPAATLGALAARREALVAASLANDAARTRRTEAQRDLAAVRAEVAALAPPDQVYAATIHHGSGAFRGTGPDGGRPRSIRVLARGDVRSPRQPAWPGAVPIIAGVPARFDLPEDAPDGERRAALARWLVDPRNPLTWRVIVNRVWQYHFGRALADSPNDLGRMGRPPTHPELLDWLASDFRDGDQSLKALHRRIVTSATYRQGSATSLEQAEVDGENALLGRMNRRRLEAEAIRDAALLVAGRLDPTAGGPGFRDFAVAHPEHSPHYEYDRVDPDAPGTLRRSVYRFVVRSQPQPLLGALDCADPSVSVDRRIESTTALQALALRHDRLMVALAGHLAERVARERPTLDAQVEWAIELALGRPPTTAERTALVAHAERRGLASACRVVFNLNEFVFVD